MIRYLSYKLSSLLPVYGLREEKMELRQINSINKGDVYETFYIGLQNHWGTHVDCPAHFFVDGMRVADYEAEFWLFRKPQVFSINLEPGQIVCRKDLTEAINPETDLLLLQSGWSKLRGTEIYSLQNPGIDPLLGVWLREEYPLLRAIGFDWISLSSYKHRELGRDAHRSFLNPQGKGHPILIIEDMDMSEDMQNLREVLVLPLRIEGIDSAPCTVIGVFE